MKASEPTTRPTNVSALATSSAWEPPTLAMIWTTTAKAASQRFMVSPGRARPADARGTGDARSCRWRALLALTTSNQGCAGCYAGALLAVNQPAGAAPERSSARVGGAQALRERLQELPGHRAVALDERAELPERQPV